MPVTKAAAFKMPADEQLVEYRTRNVPASVLARARLVAALRHVSLESVVAEALVYGMKQIEAGEDLPPGLARAAAKRAAPAAGAKDK